ncbi:hypothetical protein M0R72_21660 [Candidatus Pacearchaeota archaeon]|jgi:hypothetical protein|nr:hypothetical protein [Candidatus Pacearchaeota archaeon]
MPGSIPLPQISLGKNKEKSQMCEVVTTDGRLVVDEIPVTANCADSDKRGCAFIIDNSEQYLAEDGSFHQLVSDKSRLPLMPVSEVELIKKKEKELDGIADDIFDLTEDMKINEQFANARKNDRGDVIKWVVSIVMGAFVIIAAMQYLWG